MYSKTSEELPLPSEGTLTREQIRKIVGGFRAMARAYEIEYFDDYILNKVDHIDNYYEHLEADVRYKEIMLCLANISVFLGKKYRK